ncbi:MAG: translation initiation factor IF-2 [Clostridia bacterium]|nr:translation initiation factor IF-2 [Clostridia bacterium]
MENKTNKQISFDNLRSLSQINNKDLIKMDKEVKELLEKLEKFGKDVREQLKKKVAQKEEASLAVKKEQKEEKKEAVFVADKKPTAPKVEQKVWQNKEKQQKPQYPNNKNSFSNQKSGQFKDKKQGFTSFNNQNKNTPQKARKESQEFLKQDFPQTSKKVFDNKKRDNEKRDRELDKMNRSKKFSRQGLMEEYSITERIMGSRKIKSKKTKQEEVVVSAPIDHAVISTENITIKTLSEKTGRSVADILKQLMVLGIVSNLNSTIDFQTAELVCSELGVVLEQKLEKTFEEKLADEFMVEDEKHNTTPRPPIVAVLGHVDHGKTSLLDYIRHSHIASGEAGGITQNISAYQIETNGKKITFIDTPGHEAFSAMRERGASVTDIAILVVAGDDGIMPQTIEAIKHIKKANVPMIVAVNKMDKKEFNLERVKEQLTAHDVVPEDWGGSTIVVPISALTGQNVEKLLEMVLLVADMQELKSNPNSNALGMIIESKLDKGKGPIATIIVLNGTLKVGDTIISGVHAGKVRALINDKGVSVKKAGPSSPVSVLGLDGVPNVGDNIYVVDEKMSKQILAERKRKAQTEKIANKTKFSMEEFLATDAGSEKKVLNVIVKADVQGAFEAVVELLNKVQNEEVKVECIHGGVGAINENDVLLAKSANAHLIGFNVKPDSKAQIIIEHNKMPIYMSKIIYQIVDYVSKTIKAMRKPIFEEKVIGHAEVIRIFKISRIGTVAGCVVKDGRINKNSKIRLFRGKDMLVDTTITTLQKDKNDIKEVLANMECGIKLEGHNDILVGDMVEAYVIEQIERD